MTAVAYSDHGNNFSQLLMIDKAYPRPEVTDDGLLIQIKAASINPIDFKILRNSLTSPLTPKPKIPGVDVAGIIVEIGNDLIKMNRCKNKNNKSNRFQVGDRVAALLPLFGSRWGTAAQYVNIPYSFAAKIPDSVDFISAAAVPLVGLTTLRAFEYVSHKNKQAGNKILIQAGGGGVGTFAIQYAKNVLGMNVTTTVSSSKRKQQALRNLGADVVIDYKTTRFEEIVADYDIVLDPMSWMYEGRTLGGSSRVLKPTGHYLNILSTDWEQRKGREKINTLLSMWNIFKSKFLNLLSGKITPKYDTVMVEPRGAHVKKLMSLLESNSIKAIIDKKFELAKASKAFEYLKKGRATGKVVLVNGIK